MSISESQYRDMLARTQRNQPLPESVSKERESALHDQIIEECKRRGWYYDHSRMDKPTTNAVGSPDFKIALPGGVTLWVECKRPRQKPTFPQLSVAAQLRKLNHRHAFIYDFQSFLDFVKNVPF